MRKVLAVALALLSVFGLVACGSGDSSHTWTPTRASSEVEPYARKAIEIIDGYLAFELTVDEATNEFRELRRRIEPFDIRGIDSTYNDPDQRIAHIIEMLSILDADKTTDLEYYEYRDILAFQIGEAVSGKSYDPDRYGIDDCPKMLELFDADTFPIEFANEHEFEDDWYWWSMTFDELSGVSITDFQSYIESVYDDFINSSMNEASFNFYYKRYEQDVFYISLDFMGEKLTGAVYRDGEEVEKARELLNEKLKNEEISSMEELPEELSILKPLYEFTSIEQLPDAIKAAQSYAGIK